MKSQDCGITDTPVLDAAVSFDGTWAKVEFRFEKQDGYWLAAALCMPESFIVENGVVVESTEALCICLICFAYPCRYAYLIPRFARPVSQLSIVSNLLVNYVNNEFGSHLVNLDQPWLSWQNIKIFADAIHAKGAALDNCCGFVDGTVRPICKPAENQRAVYKGHKRVHALQFQSVVTPNGLITHLFGPVEGRRHSSAMLVMSDLLPQLEQHSFFPTGQAMCIYGDPAYPHRIHLQCPFAQRAGFTPEQQALIIL